jgi:hypothetical protein
MDSERSPESSPDAAIDILTAAGVPPDRAASYVMHAAVDGKDPVAWAAHFAELREAFSGGQV